MSGHSKWSTIKRKKGAQDAKRGKIFTRIIREIMVAAKNGGPDPESNSRLRLAIQNAKSNNMPSKNIDNAIAKGSGQADDTNYDEVVYEGYGPEGIAIMVETLTDNRNRTVSEVRHILSKNGGNLGENGSVAWIFESKGVIQVNQNAITEDELMELVLENGAEDMEVQDTIYEIKTSVDDFENVRSVLEKKGIEMLSAEITKIPQNTIKVEGANASKILKLMEALEDQDDVQNVYSNFDIDEKEMEKLAG